ncbi:hypothetical protein [Labrys wisconsinensis]|uniref:Secreted protein n=1 Tax=Labrys wisconsinensis TaxID=425677 RepID=A0ABU0JLL5_9HYPH|nr:hypothetical protein [Labrys wisconsinensis]MDQ0474510.1 hypothetical protein [Labrys wisconsinensis]
MIRIVTGLLLLLDTSAWAPPAAAHQAPTGWQYPVECCGGHDCYEIQASDLQVVAGGWKVLATGQIFGSSQVRHSPDGRYYRCSYGGDPARTTNCLFVPDQNS